MLLSHTQLRLGYQYQYPLQIEYKNDIYGIRQTTTKDHYTDDGILYAGKNEPPNIKVSFETIDKNYKLSHIGTGCKVVPHVYDNAGKYLGNLADYKHSIRIYHIGGGLPSPSIDLTQVSLREKVTVFVEGVANQPVVEYFEDTLEIFDTSKLFAKKDDVQDNLKHFVWANI